MVTVALGFVGFVAIIAVGVAACAVSDFIAERWQR